MSYYTVYRTTNLVNQKQYIGHHKTDDLDDAYLGSGSVLSHAIKKYGREAFQKETLFVYDNHDDMIKKETELVNNIYCARQDTYNLMEGGKGGFGHINAQGLNNITRKLSNEVIEIRRVVLIACGGNNRETARYLGIDEKAVRKFRKKYLTPT